MGRIIRLTESDLARIVRRVIRENEMILSENDPGGMGLRRETIMVVQEKLGIHADGNLGPETKTAIMNFQKRNNMTPDGKLGPSTLSRMGVKSTDNPRSGIAPPVFESRRRYRNY